MQAIDQVINSAAKTLYMSAGDVSAGGYGQTQCDGCICWGHDGLLIGSSHYNS